MINSMLKVYVIFNLHMLQTHFVNTELSTDAPQEWL